MRSESTPAIMANPAAQADLEAAERVHNEIIEWLLDNASLSAPLHEIEAEHGRRGLELLRRLFQAHIRARGTGRVGAALLVIEGGVEQRFEEGREHQCTQKTYLAQWRSSGKATANREKRAFILLSRWLRCRLGRSLTRFSVVL